MSDTIRAQIIAAFDTRMKAIKTTGGYVTNLGNNVFAWRASDLAATELPAMIYRDTENDRSSGKVGGYRDNLLTIEMEIYPAEGTATITDALKLIQDIYTAIAIDDRWGGLADDTNPGRDTLEIEQHDKIIGRITLSIVIEYTSTKWSF